MTDLSDEQENDRLRTRAESAERQLADAQAKLAAARAEAQRLREAVEAALDEHEPVGPIITGVPPSCPVCIAYAPCETTRLLRAALAQPGDAS